MGEVSYEIIPDSNTPVIVAELGNKYFAMKIDKRGRCVSFIDKRTGRELISGAEPMAALRAGGRAFGRVRCSYSNGTLTYTFGLDEAEAQIGAPLHLGHAKAPRPLHDGLYAQYYLIAGQRDAP